MMDFVTLEQLRHEYPCRPGQNPTGGLAFVVMQFASEPWDLFPIVAAELKALGYYSTRADRVPNRDDPSHVWTLLKEADLVLVDVSHWNVNVFMELGAVAAYREAAHGKSHDIALIADSRILPESIPFDLKPFHFHGYEPRSENSIRAAARAAVMGSRGLQGIQTHPLYQVAYNQSTEDVEDGRRILAGLPLAVRSVLRDPAAAFIAARYIQHLGELTSDELAASAGFRPIVGSAAPWVTRPADHALNPAISGWVLATDLLAEDLRDTAEAVVAKLIKIVWDRDRRVSQSPDVVRLADVDRRLLFVQALLTPSGERTSGEIEVLGQILSSIATLSATQPDPGVNHWREGLHAVRQLTRMRAISAAPTSLATMGRIERAATTADEPPLELIATLGGAYYLGSSLAILREVNSDYYQPGYDLIASLPEGQRVRIPEGEVGLPAKDEAFGHYKRGLEILAQRPSPLTFSIEHPFHFRVLLELLSGENRRYAAECILTHEGLARIIGDAPDGPLLWCRGQLPVVANLVGESSGNGSSLAFVQDYAAYGRTPHTSSFMRIEYTDQAAISKQAWWPDPLSAGDVDVQNLPRSVSEARASIRRQRSLARLWAGEPNEDDLRKARGAILSWEPAFAAEANVARLLSTPDRWPDLTFPELVVAELWTGEWICRSLVSWRSAARGERFYGQLDAVTRIVGLFLASYLGDRRESIGGLLASLDSCRRRGLVGQTDALARFADAAAGRLRRLDLS